MRLNRLDLTRYGKFTDHGIDFPRPEDGAPDLHLVYGPNEAGKSTLFNAWLDLLFGIETQSSYNFLHPYSSMRIGAEVEFGDGCKQFVRIKRPQSSLLNAGEQPVPDAILTAALGGLDRDSYRTMFSLDDETLEKGGESILENRGDLGELLFSASAGLGELSQRLNAIRSEADHFYKYRARSGELSDLKSELAALKAERDDLDTQASDHARLTAAHQDAATRHLEATERRREHRIRLKQVDAMLGTLPRVQEREELLERTGHLENVPQARPEFADEISRLREDEARFGAGGEAIEQQLSGLDQELSGVVVDETILSVRDDFARLAKLHARHATAQEDIPKLKLALGDINADINRLLIGVGRRDQAEAEALVLDAAASSALYELMDRRSAIDTQLGVARKEAGNARANLEEAEASLPGGAGPGVEMTSDSRQSHLAALTAALARARMEDHGHRLKTSERGLVAASKELEDLLRSLAPWGGEMAQLKTMSPPSTGEIAARKSEVEDENRRAMRLDEEISRHAQSLQRLTVEREAIVQTVDLPRPETLRTLRETRDSAWTLHRSGFDEVSADAFEAAMVAHDKAVEQHSAFHADAARLREIAVRAATAQADLEAAQANREALAAQSEAGVMRWRGLIASMTQGHSEFGQDLSPTALETWLSRRQEALERGLQIRELEQEAGAAQKDRRASGERLTKALTALGEAVSDADDFDTLMVQADILISRETALDGLRRAEAAARRDLSRRETDLRNAEDEATAWHTAWKSACATCWLGEGERVPPVNEVRQVLSLLVELDAALKQRASLLDRIAKMQRDTADYELAVAELATTAGIDDAGQPVSAVAQRLSERLSEAEAARRQYQTLAEQREKLLERRDSHAEGLNAHQKLRSELLTLLGAETLAEAAHKIAQALERRALCDQISALERQLRDSLSVPTTEDALRVLQKTDRSALEQEKDEIEAELERLDTEVQELHAARTRASEALGAVGGDDAVARIEQRRRATLEAISEGAIDYLRLSGGVLAMEQALSLYREHHRSSMMARASDAIQTISRGYYTGLAAQPDKDRELLFAITRDGASKQVSEMSKGARFQLYLALRVAGYHEFARSRETVPFIADDIMETFDDFRAEESFRLFSGMAEVGQVIYLTHHRHLCDIARSVCPRVHVHDLTD